MIGNFVGGMKRSVDGAVLNVSANTNVNNTTTETVLATVTLPANFLKVGRTFETIIRGFHSSTSGNFRYRMRWGGVSGVVVLDTGSFSGGSHTDKGWVFRSLLTGRSTGASGTIIGQGEYHELVSNETREATNTTTATIDTTTSKDLVLTVEMSAANVNNSVTVTNGIVKVHG